MPAYTVKSFSEIVEKWGFVPGIGAVKIPKRKDDDIFYRPEDGIYGIKIEHDFTTGAYWHETKSGEMIKIIKEITSPVLTGKDWKKRKNA